MAAFRESRLVWSATLVMVVTTELMLLVFSLTTASLDVMELEASMICRMVASICGDGRLTAAREVGRFFRHVVDLIHGFHQLLGGGGDFFGRGANFCRGRGNFIGGALLLFGRGHDLSRGDVDLNARTLHLADQSRQIIRQTI